MKLWNCEIQWNFPVIVKFLCNFTISHNKWLDFQQFHNFTISHFTCEIFMKFYNFTISNVKVWNICGISQFHMWNLAPHYHATPLTRRHIIKVQTEIKSPRRIVSISTTLMRKVILHYSLHITSPSNCIYKHQVIKRGRLVFCLGTKHTRKVIHFKLVMQVCQASWKCLLYMYIHLLHW